ncbi:MAG: S41 family peptidase [Acidobacteriota bacterium]
MTMFKYLLRRITVVMIVVLLLGLGMTAGIVLEHQTQIAHAQTGTTPTPTAAGPDMQLITEAWNTINRVYVDRSALQGKSLTYGAISGMVSALGDTGHSTFMSPGMAKSERDYTQGSFEGIGAEVENKDGHVTIVAPFDGSPAAQAGLKPGDAILKVDDQDVTGLPLEQVIGKILGPAGTHVKLTVLDPKTGQKRDLDLVRAKIVMHNVTWQKLPGTNIAHLRLMGFSQGVSQQLKQALAEMQQQGVVGVILDLRNNPGGLLNEAVNTTSQFLSSGDVLLEQDARGQTVHVAVKPGGVATGMPMVVLINNGSASASEIVAGALQDAGRARLVGETTFGTGTVLSEFPLSDGSAMMLAIQEWLTPNGRVIWHKGITPDDAVTQPDGGTQLTPDAERNMTADQLRGSSDQQLLQGLKLLTQSALNQRSGASLNPGPASNAAAETSSSPLALELQLLAQFNYV